MTKSEYRKYYKNIRNSLSEHDARKKAEIITRYLTEMEIIKKSKTIFVYLSYGREVSTDSLVKFLLAHEKTVLIPKCNSNLETMIAVEYTERSKLTKGNYGIREPVYGIEFKEDIDLIIVPGIAFDKFGNRIGHGKGYYDKFLKNKNICKVGLCYAENLSDEKLPCSDDDEAMNYVVCDRGVLKTKV